MEIEKIRGIIVPIITPVDEQENIDEKSLRKQVDFVIDNGVHGILAYGSNGEFYMFDDEELEQGLKIILDETKGRVPVYMGIGAIRTRNAIRLAKIAEKNHVFGISVLSPMFLTPTEEELFEHFKSVAESVPELPVLLYNNPGRVGYGLSVKLVERLARNVKNIVGLKDTSGDYSLMSEFIRTTRDIEFRVFSGKDTLVYGGLCTGSVGGVCTAANIYPELVSSIYNFFQAGDYKASLEAQFRLNPVRISMDAASFPVAAKEMANIRGLKVGKPIKPNLTSPEKVLQQMKSEMKKAGVDKLDDLIY